MCAELLPERIALDDWGYPIVDGRPLSRRAARRTPSRAAQACPTFALLIQADGAPIRASSGASRPAPPTVRNVQRRPEPVLRRQTRSDPRR